MLKGIIICFAVAITSCYGDYMVWTAYWDLLRIINHILLDATNKIHQTDSIRDLVSNENGFQVGLIMGRIRDKYRTMLELYRMCKTKYKNNPKLNLPDMKVIVPLYYLSRMEIIHGLEVDIDNLVQILESIPKKKLNPSVPNWKPTVMKEPQEQVSINGMDPDQIKRWEEQYKNQLRSEYYLRINKDRDGDPNF